MVPSMKVITNTGRNTGLVLSNGLIILSTLVSSIITIFMEREFIHGVTVGDMKVNGKIIRCMVMVPSHGQMVESMLDNMLTIKNKVTVNSYGLMEDHTKVIGIMESNTDVVYM